jgi:hypothetical protein
MVATGVSHELAYIVGIEHTTASVAGASPASLSLRAHRHGDPVPNIESSAAQDGLIWRQSGTLGDGTLARRGNDPDCLDDRSPGVSWNASSVGSGVDPLSIRRHGSSAGHVRIGRAGGRHEL